MSTGHHEHSGPQASELAGRLKEATELLESVARDRGLLGALSVDERTRLLAAAGDVYNPDVVQRRMGASPSGGGRRREAPRDETVLAETGIRVLRDEAGVHDAERLPAGRLRAGRRRTRAGAPRGDRAAALLRLQAAVRRDPSLLRPALPAVRASFNFAKRTETADLRGRVALLTGGRVKIGYQAGHQAAARRART